MMNEKLPSVLDHRAEREPLDQFGVFDRVQPGYGSAAIARTVAEREAVSDAEGRWRRPLNADPGKLGYEPVPGLQLLRKNFSLGALSFPGSYEPTVLRSGIN